jgi:hypothetical protein
MGASLIVLVLYEKVAAATQITHDAVAFTANILYRLPRCNLHLASVQILPIGL